MEILSDYNSKEILELSQKIVDVNDTSIEKVRKIFEYVKNDIKFGYPMNGDFVKASETLKLKLGQCNTKTTLFHALCKSLNIPSRIHFALINKKIQRGLFTKVSYVLLPKLISHSWIEVELNNQWISIDSYINDEEYYQAALQKLKQENEKTGYSVSFEKNKSSSSFSIDNRSFVQMDAVVYDQGIWNDSSEYYNTKLYKNKTTGIKKILYKLLIPKVNKKVQDMRNIKLTIASN